MSLRKKPLKSLEDTKNKKEPPKITIFTVDNKRRLRCSSFVCLLSDCNYMLIIRLVGWFRFFRYRVLGYRVTVLPVHLYVQGKWSRIVSGKVYKVYEPRKGKREKRPSFGINGKTNWTQRETQRLRSYITKGEKYKCIRVTLSYAFGFRKLNSSFRKKEFWLFIYSLRMMLMYNLTSLTIYILESVCNWGKWIGEWVRVGITRERKRGRKEERERG